MVNIKEINLILESIPTLLQYFIPGSCAVYLFGYFCSKKVSSNVFAILSCIVSYILISIVALLRAKFEWSENIPDTALINSGIAVVLGTTTSIVAAIIFSSDIFSKVTVFLFQKTPNDSIWRDVINLKDGSNFKIYIKEKEYYVIGHCKNLEDKGEESWFSVSSFMKYDKTSSTLIETHENDSEAVFVVRLSDVEHIEIFN